MALLKRNIPVCPEGIVIIAVTAFSALLFAILSWAIPSVLCWLLFLFSLHFFRDPQRISPVEKDIAISPADGTIVSIEKREDPFGCGSKQCISIFMSVFNVHVNRSPVNCVVLAIRYYEGLFINASFDKASEGNERCAWLLEDEDRNKWTMVQIAGLVARRIVCFAQTGERLTAGERIGMIRFGSRVDLYIPSDYSPTVETGAKVYGGQTIIARRNIKKTDSDNG